VISVINIIVTPLPFPHPMQLSDKPECYEVNVIACKDNWKIVLYQEHHADAAFFLKGGDIVRFFHAEEGKYLTADTTPQGRHAVFLRNTQRPNKVPLVVLHRVLAMCVVAQGDEVHCFSMPTHT
jgi:hypothetical protein